MMLGMPSPPRPPTASPTPWAALTRALLPPLELSLVATPLAEVEARAARSAVETVRPAPVAEAAS